MGYSCTKKAGDTLDRLVQYYLEKGEKMQNVFTVKQASCMAQKEKQYMWEIGRENKSGAITGKVCEFTGPSEQKLTESGQPYDSRPAVNVGSFRIAPDGKITKFPGLPADVKKYLNALVTESFVVIP
jgi:hypothetical protein